MTATPKSVSAAFDVFDVNISLNPAARLRAEARHRQVAAVLVAAGLASSTFLQGSFARKTMRKPLKDVDIVVLLPQSMKLDWKTPSGAQQIHDLFKTPLSQHYGAKISFDQTVYAGKALQLCFTDEDFTIDLVAAFETDDPNWVEIADRKDRHWEPSNTRQLLEVVAARNKLTDGRFIHQVRMVKEFVAQDDAFDGLCGLVTEALTYQAVTQTLAHSLAVAATLEYAATAMASQVLDPTGVDDLSVKWTSEQRQRYAHAFGVGNLKATEALRLEKGGQITAAMDSWSLLLGEDFPDVPNQTGADIVSQYAAGGTVTSTGRVTPSLHGAGGGRPTRSWSTR